MPSSSGGFGKSSQTTLIKAHISRSGRSILRSAFIP
jgi:hypothetical protein